MHEPLPAHSPFGGSVAARILGCPASVGLVAKVPEELRRPSAYADRGTALHAVMAMLLDDDKDELYDDFIDAEIEGYVITEDDITGAVMPVLSYVNELLNAPGAEFYLEKRVTFPGITAFGTADLLVHINNIVHVIDYKFGSGVRVRALSPDGEEDLINAQLLFYAVAARASAPEFFAGVDYIVLTILQPQSIEPDAEFVSSVTVSHAELDAFAEAYHAACAKALNDAGAPKRGAYCQFCPAKPICPEHTGPLLDLAAFPMPSLTTAPSKEAYLQALAHGLELADAVKEIVAALREQAKTALDAGDAVPGYALSAGRAERRWQDEPVAIQKLMALGLAREDLVAEEMRTPAQVEKRAKTHGIKVPADLIVSTRSGTSLVRADHARFPVPGREESVRLYAEALESLSRARRVTNERLDNLTTRRGTQ